MHLCMYEQTFTWFGTINRCVYTHFNILESIQWICTSAPFFSLSLSLLQTAEIEYNLDLLHRMLECHAVQGLVNEASYNHAIEKWVQDVRSQSPSSRGSHHQEEHDLQDVSSCYQESVMNDVYCLCGFVFHTCRKSSLHIKTPTVSLCKLFMLLAWYTEISSSHDCCSISRPHT